MNDFLGLAAIIFIILITLFISLRWPGISKIIFVALFVRILFILIGHYFITLPDSNEDAAEFERLAAEFAQSGFFNIFSHYTGASSYFISWIIAIPYSLFGRSILMAKSISLFFGIGSVLLGWLLTRKLWNDQVANKIGWIISLFPSLVLYSSLTLRESYITFFLLLAMIGVVDWVKTKSFKSIIIATMGFIGATFFHGAMITGLIVFLIIILVNSIRHFYKLINKGKIGKKSFIFMILGLIFITIYPIDKISVPKFGTFQEAADLSRLSEHTGNVTIGDASFPKWTKINSNIEFIYKTPVRALYFIFSPFPWEIKKVSHLIGFFDSLSYMFMAYLIFYIREVILEDPALYIILSILICYFFVFGIGVGNFGTAFRHRSKFIIEFIVIAGPFIPKLLISKKT